MKQKQAVRRAVKKFDSEPNYGATPKSNAKATPPAPKPAPVSRPASRPEPARQAPAPKPVARPAARPAASQAPIPQPPQKVKLPKAPIFDNDSDSDSGSDSDYETRAGPSRLPMTSAAPAVPAKPAAPQIVSGLFTAYQRLPKVKSEHVEVGAPTNAPVDTSSFASLGLHKFINRHLKNKLEIKAPTGIQQACLPYMLSYPLDPHARRDDDEEEGDDSAFQVSDDAPRDVLIQAQTGSGKTLAYLLPIVQALLPLSKLSYIDRSIGTLAIIMAPTRELAQQISKVLESLLTMSLAADDDDSEDEHYTRWLVSGLLVGGSTRTHEKAKLRKGVPILVSTPGRLLDHLQNTASFQCGKCMFLILDEADRLMDLGFEETITGIIKALDGRRRNEINAEKEQDAEGGGLMRWPYWNRGRQTVLCSATVDAKVEKLAGIALRDPVLFKAADKEKEEARAKKAEAEKNQIADAVAEANAIVIPQDEKFTPPSQLSQKYVVTPTKLRLVALVALLRSLVSDKANIEMAENGNKVIVFLSSTDAVDYHFRLLGGVTMGGPAPAKEDEDEESSDAEGEGSDSEDSDGEAKPKKEKKKKAAKKPSQADAITLESPLFPKTTIQRLHGSLPLKTRLASLKAFAEPSPNPSILLATSVASRGLDLPLVRAVVQYDLPTEGGAAEYVHRVGRTARAGKGGEAWAFVAPSEAEWVPWVEGKMGRAEGTDTSKVKLTQVGVEEVLRRGFGGKGYEYEQRATDVQLAFERWVLEDPNNAALARKAFASFVRAYSTHPIEEKRFFHVKSIHLGHLAKAFALREAPTAATAAAAPKKQKERKDKLSNKRKREEGEEDEPRKGGKETTARNETERRMYEAVRKQGRQFKSGGALGAFSGNSAGEFHVMDTSALEKMVNRK